MTSSRLGPFQIILPHRLPLTNYHFRLPITVHLTFLIVSELALPWLANQYPMRFVYVIVFILATGCNRDDDFTPIYDVPEELQPLIDSFIYEASLRGISVSISNLIIEYDDNQASNICASCNSASLSAQTQKIITINAHMQCWFDALELENLLFHELGHCVLGRPHNDEQLPNGDPKSIMVAGNVSLYAPCIYQIGDEPCNDNTFKRAYYLDELFDANAPIPDWAD